MPGENMPWYRTGTVSVTLNNTTVTGTGTAFAANSRVGDAFLGPDGRWYEVANIASDTVLSILPAYQGATAAAGTYALAPIQGYVKASADQLRSIVASFGDKMAALGTTGNYDTLPVAKGGTGANDAPGARAALGAVAKAGDTMTGALNEAAPVTLASAATVAIGAAAANTVSITGSVAITAFDTIAAGARRTLIFAAGLTLTYNASKLVLPGAANIVTAAGDVAEVESLGSGNWKCTAYFRSAELPDLVRSVAQGGTGVTTMAALVSALLAAGAYGKGNVVGTVSQSGGVPTGAIIETGTNVNGTYVKYADGTLICAATGSTLLTCNIASGSLYVSATTTMTFPATFISVPVLSIGSYRPSGIAVGPQWCYSTANTTTTTTVYPALASVSSGPSGYPTYIAVGRWY